MIGLYENLHLEAVSCACFADGRTFVTGGTDAVSDFKYLFILKKYIYTFILLFRLFVSGD